MWKLPPKAKIYEALTAVADGRVTLLDGNRAEVRSSDHSKRYTVTWDDARTAFRSDDNASFWQGYLGYPIVAVLMILGILPFANEVATSLAGVEWKRVNDAHKRNYDAAIVEVMNKMESEGRGDPAVVRLEVDRIFDQLSNMKFSKFTPPRAQRA